MIHIYGLVESGKQVGQIRYIGITTDPTQRLHQHRTAKEDTDKGRWIANLRKSGKNVDMVLLDSAATRDDAHVKENAWILFARSRGWSITNGTNPGEHRALLEGEISNIETAISTVSKVLVENASIKADMLYKLEVERKKGEDRQMEIDNHFRRWYQFFTAIILGTLSIAVSVWLLSSYPYHSAIEADGWIGATTMLVGISVAYPCIAFVLWFFLKDVPLYRPRVGSDEWVASLNNFEAVSYDALKRIAWHVIGTLVVLGAIVLFGG